MYQTCRASACAHLLLLHRTDYHGCGETRVRVVSFPAAKSSPDSGAVLLGGGCLKLSTNALGRGLDISDVRIVFISALSARSWNTRSRVDVHAVTANQARRSSCGLNLITTTLGSQRNPYKTRNSWSRIYRQRSSAAVDTRPSRWVSEWGFGR
jgi:hypothetical protein